MAKAEIPELIEIEKANTLSVYETLREGIQSNRKARQDSLFDTPEIQDQSKSYVRPNNLEEFFN